MRERLPDIRGQYRENFNLSEVTWFRVGGAAEILFKPADAADLAYFLTHKPRDIPHIVIGVGSNLLVRDGGVKGVVIRLGRAFAEINVIDARSEDRASLELPEGLRLMEKLGDFSGANQITTGAGALDFNVAECAAQHGIGGLEFLCGIPGTIGGALFMNAGAYGSEIKDVLIWAEGIDAEGKQHRLTPEECGFTYRHSHVPEGFIFTRACLKGTPKPEAEIRARMQEISNAREATQPVRSRTGGSTFANPDGHRAWQLVDAAGCRGLKKGGAQMSEQHCNFMINMGDATAADLENLGEEVRARVKAQSGIDLRWEIQRIGTI